MTGDELLEFADKTLFPALKNMELGPRVDGDSAEDRAARALRRRRQLVKSVCEDAYQYMKSGTLLRQVVNRLQEDIDFNEAKTRHLFGDVYEQILKDLQSAGNAGEYYPLPEQHRIVAKVDELMALCDDLEARLTAARNAQSAFAAAAVHHLDA